MRVQVIVAMACLFGWSCQEAKHKPNPIFVGVNSSATGIPSSTPLPPEVSSDLSYCIHKPDFEEHYQATVDTVAAAAEEWMVYANIKFKHESQLDEADCRDSQTVRLKILANNEIGQARASYDLIEGSHDIGIITINRSRHEELFTGVAAADAYKPLILHQLGHGLGLGPEHELDPTGSQGGDPHSIVYYPWETGSLEKVHQVPQLAFVDKIIAMNYYPRGKIGQISLSQWFSEEDGGTATCKDDELIVGIQCQGDFCDNKRIACGKHQEEVDLSVDWSAAVSEEQGTLGYEQAFMSGLKCTGRYCDNLQSLTVDLSIPAVDAPVCGQGHSFTDDILDNDICVDGGAVSQIHCEGRYCDNLKITCCTL